MAKAPRQRDPDLMPPEKAGKTIQVRIGGAMKDELQEALGAEFDGKFSKFFMECARAAIFHHRRGEKVRVPVEFVTGK